jgi:hypothetical protein
MGKRRYNAARLELIVLAEGQIERNDNAAAPISKTLKRAYRDQAEDLIAAFEEVVEKRGWWRGVWQSFWGAWAYTLSLGLIPIILWCSHLDGREMWNKYVLGRSASGVAGTSTPANVIGAQAKASASPSTAQSPVETVKASAAPLD